MHAFFFFPGGAARLARIWTVCFFLFLPAFSAGAQEKPEEETPQIAVWDFNLTEMNKTDGQAIANSLRSALVNTRVFRVMTRDQIDTLLGEQALGQTLVDAKEAIKAGKLKGVKYVVTGSLIAIRGAFQATFEMIDGASGEIIHSITPRTFRGDFLDFLDIEVPKIADQLAGVEKGAATLVVAPKPERSLPPPPVSLQGKRLVYIPPGNFTGTGSTFFEKENPQLIAFLKQLVEGEFPAYAVFDPFAEENKGDPEIEKVRRVDLRKTLWRGVAGLPVGPAFANMAYVNNLAEVVRMDMVVLIETSSGLFSGADAGSYSVTLYTPQDGETLSAKGDWERETWMKDIGDGLRGLLQKFRPPR